MWLLSLQKALLLAFGAVASARHASGQHLSSGKHASELPSTSQMSSEPPRISRGYCGVTNAKSDCATSSMGSWSMNNATRCIQRCLGCARCNFISFSPEAQDCSWYHKCSLAHLPGAQGTHGTVQVQRSSVSSDWLHYDWADSSQWIVPSGNSKRPHLMPAFVQCKRVRNASAAAPCLLGVDRGNGIHIAGHRNRHGAGFCAQLPLTHGPANTCNGYPFKAMFDTPVLKSKHDWLARMEVGSKIWANTLAISISKQHSAAYGSDFLSDTNTTRRPKQHLAPPFSTGQVNRQVEGVVHTFPEWQGCWGCVHNDTDQHCCSGRGDCRVGLCMCRDGAFGMDCAHEAEAEATQAPPKRGGRPPHGRRGRPLAAVEAAAIPQGLRIYVHEMPFEFGQTWLASVALARLRYITSIDCNYL